VQPSSGGGFFGSHTVPLLVAPRRDGAELPSALGRASAAHRFRLGAEGRRPRHLAILRAFEPVRPRKGFVRVPVQALTPGSVLATQ
jgi:hypothetical protein